MCARRTLVVRVVKRELLQITPRGSLGGGLLRLIHRELFEVLLLDALVDAVAENHAERSIQPLTQ